MNNVPPAPDSRTLALTGVAMLALAANPLLCRMALGAGDIDAASFTGIRVVAGALMLRILMTWTSRGGEPRPVDWRAVVTLFGYMVFFSFAYLSISVGTGALILFGAVLFTMFAVALRAGERFSVVSWTGLIIAMAGLVYLVSPGVTAPEPVGAALMAVAGVAWGLYSLLGRGEADPIGTTADNFLYAIPLAAGVSIVFWNDMHATWRGVTMAVLSGAVASGLGYALWYAVLAGMAATRAATAQLSVPVIAAFGGVVLLAEPVTARLLVSSAATLGGIALVLFRRESGNPAA
ncbi:MAG TPA: DMT family transporter [Afifellaceae bacterium]|nr:DMT family transporter [Afifellaceae bacterium]